MQLYAPSRVFSGVQGLLRALWEELPRTPSNDERTDSFDVTGALPLAGVATILQESPRRMLLTHASLWLAGSTPLRGAIECHLAGRPANLFYLFLNHSNTIGSHEIM
jgi:hypothetical protein